MNKIARVLGATLGASAIIGTSAVAANAHGFGGHDGHASHDSHATAGYSKTGPYSVRGAHQQFTKFSHHHGAQGKGNAFAVGHEFNHHWYKHHWQGRHHHHLSFSEKQAAIVAKLTKADTRLSALIAKLSDAAQQNPDGWAAQALPYLQQEQTKLETLISAVKAATNQQELAAAFKGAFTPPTPPATPTPTPTQQPTSEPTTPAPTQAPTSSAPTSSAPTAPTTSATPSSTATPTA